MKSSQEDFEEGRRKGRGARTLLGRRNKNTGRGVRGEIIARRFRRKAEEGEEGDAKREGVITERREGAGVRRGVGRRGGVWETGRE